MDKKAKLFTKRIAERLANDGPARLKAKSVLQTSIENISRDSLKKELIGNFGIYANYLKKCMKRLQVNTLDSSADKNIQLIQTWEDCRHLSQLNKQDNRHLCTHVLIKELEGHRTDLGQILQQYEERCHTGRDSAHVAWMASTQHLLSTTRNPVVITKLMLYYLSKVQLIAEEDMMANKVVTPTLEHLKHFLSMSYMRSDELDPENTEVHQKRNDVLSSLLSIFVDLLVYTNRNNEKKKVAKEITSYTSYLLGRNWETTLDVLLQVSSPVESHHLLPFVRSCLVRVPSSITDPAVYLKLMLCLRKFHDVVPDIVEKNLAVRAPLGFIDWLTERSSEVISEIPDDAKFKGRQITLFLLKNASDELQLLLEDVLTDREAVCDLEVRGEATEVTAAEAPVFVVDRTGQEKQGNQTLKTNKKKKKECSKKQKQSNKKKKFQKGAEPGDVTVEGNNSVESMDIQVIDLSSVLDSMMESESSQPGPVTEADSESENSNESVQEDKRPMKQKESSKKKKAQKGAEPGDVKVACDNMEVEVIDLASVLDVMMQSEPNQPDPAIESISESEADSELDANSMVEAIADSEESSSESVKEDKSPKKVGKERKNHSDSEINKSSKKIGKERKIHSDSEINKSSKKILNEDGEIQLDTKISKSPKKVVYDLDKVNLEHGILTSFKKIGKEFVEVHIGTEMSKSPKKASKHFEEVVIDTSPSDDDNDNNISVPNLAQHLLNENQVVPTMYIAAENNKDHTESINVGVGQELPQISSAGVDSSVEIIDTSDSVMEEVDANGTSLNFTRMKSDSRRPRSRSLNTTPVRKQLENTESKLQDSAKRDKHLSKSMIENEVIAIDTDSDEVIFMLDREPNVLGSPISKVVTSPKLGPGTTKGSPSKRSSDIPIKSLGRRLQSKIEDTRDSDLDVPLRLASPTNSSMSEGDYDIFSKSLSPHRRKPRSPTRSPVANPDVRSPKNTTPKSVFKSPERSVSYLYPADTNMDTPILQLFHTKEHSAATCQSSGDGLKQQSPRKGLGSSDIPPRTLRRGRTSFSDGEQTVEKNLPASCDPGRKRSISASEMSSVVKAARQADTKASKKTSPKKSPMKGKVLNVESESPSKKSGVNSEKIRSPKRSLAVLELDVITEGDEMAVVGKRSTPGLSRGRGEPAAKIPRRSSRRISESSTDGTVENLTESHETKTKMPRRKSTASSKSTRKSLGTDGLGGCDLPGSQSSATSGNDSPNRKSTKSSPTKSIESSPTKSGAPQLSTIFTTPSKDSRVGNRAIPGSGSSTPRESQRLLLLDSPMVTRSGKTLAASKKRRTLDLAPLSSCMPEIREEEVDNDSEVTFDLPI